VLTLDDVRLGADGARFRIGGVELHSPLMGRGHLRNAALALTYALASGVSIDTARDVLARLEPLRRRMERYVVDGREVLDDTAAHPESFAATFETAALIPHARAVVVYAIRGNRGIDINRRNAAALADLASAHRIDTMIVTASEGSVGPHDIVTVEERDCVASAFPGLSSVEGRRKQPVFEARLDAAVRRALEATAPGDLIVLLGAQGMDNGREALSSGRSS
jgi:UDP-N-acetylmuramoyl-L-alanyl-D-glutamate--2,6-diaminopimelate ligase